MPNISKSINRKKILQELREEKDPEKRNVTFSLPKELIKQFNSDCKKNNLTMNKVVQKLIEDYLKY